MALNQGAWQLYNTTNHLNQGAWQGYYVTPTPPVPPPTPEVVTEYRKILRQYKIFFRYFFLPILLVKEKTNATSKTY